MSGEESFGSFLEGEDVEMEGADRAHLQRLRALLGDEAVWEEPPSRLEDEVVRAITDEAAGVLHSHRERRRSRRSTRLAVLAAGIAAVATLVVAIAVVTRDAGYTVDIVGTDLARLAGGSVKVLETANGYELELNIEGLAPAPDGFYYQGWVRGEGEGVSVGTFHARGSGDHVLLWSGVDIAEYSTLNITIQEEGSGPASSGQVVMRAQLAQP
jgi:hypothetical protein